MRQVMIIMKKKGKRLPSAQELKAAGFLVSAAVKKGCEQRRDNTQEADTPEKDPPPDFGDAFDNCCPASRQQNAPGTVECRGRFDVCVYMALKDVCVSVQGLVHTRAFMHDAIEHFDKAGRVAVLEHIAPDGKPCASGIE